MGKVIKRAVWILLLGMFCVLSGAKFRRYLMLREAAAGMEAVFFPQTLGEKTEQKLDELVIRHEKEEAKLCPFYRGGGLLYYGTGLSGCLAGACAGAR